MKRRYPQWLGVVLVCLTILACSETLAAATQVNSQPTPTAISDPCPTPSSENVNQTPSPNLATKIASDALQNPVYLPLIRAAMPPSAFCTGLQSGLSFLLARYNPDLGLLNEAPQAAPHMYWLTNDNALAAYAFERLGQAEMSAALNKSILRYASVTNGLIEVVWGVPVTFPPYRATNLKIDQIGENIICREVHDQETKMDDWQEYADLGFLGALNAFNQGNLPEALSIYANTLTQFDGVGFRDKASSQKYGTYKLALALFVGATIQAPNPHREQMLGIMQGMQADNGGFITDYVDLQTPDGDTNTETTALALLALAANDCVLPPFIILRGGNHSAFPKGRSARGRRKPRSFAKIGICQTQSTIAHIARM